MKFTKYAVYLTAFLLMASASPLVQKSAVIRPITAAAEEASDVIAKGTLNESISWQLDSDYTLTITGSGDMSGITNGFSSYAKKIKNVIIRNTDSTHTITAVGSNLFSGCTALEEITLPDTITEIGSNAFRGCSKLSVCNFPSGLKKIRTRAFEGTALTELDLPGCELDERSFFYCTSLKTLTIGDGTEVIPEECFRECTSLESVYFSDSVKEIKSGGYDSNGSFYKCSSLKKVSIGKNIEKIHNYAFRTLGEGLEVTFREGVTAIPSKAFEERTELTKVVLPESLTTVNNNAFRGCSNLSVCNFPSGITKIGSRAFERTAFTELDLPGCELDERSFFYCTSLKTLTIGDGTEVIP
ncbi:MAG: leucine-rich repeat domain-containing protein, partial [Ruminococcus sp.]|nr:leucine-rich repeat domain-containing protein [Ruminococcus sp.]